MTDRPFPQRYNEEQTDEGFQFVFYCDVCGEPFRSSMFASKLKKKGKLLRRLGTVADIAWSFTGSNLAYGSGTGMDAANIGVESKLKNEYEQAFAQAVEEMGAAFRRCPGCSRTVCASDWDENAFQCVKCASGEGHVQPGAASSPLPRCSNCGSESAPGKKFCGECGNPFA